MSVRLRCGFEPLAQVEDYEVEGHDLIHGGAMHLLDLQHRCDEMVHERRVLWREGREGARSDLQRQLRQVVCVEGVLVGAHAVQNDAERPHVRLVRIGVAMDNLGGKVDGRTDDRLGELGGAREETGDAEVADLHRVI